MYAGNSHADSDLLQASLITLFLKNNLGPKMYFTY